MASSSPAQHIPLGCSTLSLLAPPPRSCPFRCRCKHKGSTASVSPDCVRAAAIVHDKGNIWASSTLRGSPQKRERPQLLQRPGYCSHPYLTDGVDEVQGHLVLPEVVPCLVNNLDTLTEICVCVFELQPQRCLFGVHYPALLDRQAAACHPC